MMNFKRITLASLAVLAFLLAHAQGPNNSGTYYRDANGKSGEELKTAMFNIIKSPKVTSYAGLKEAYKKTDVRADGYLRDWYSNITKFEPGSGFGNYKKEGDAYNREHSMPQSWFGKQSPMVSDIVHVFPTDGYINNMRSDYPFGEVNPNASNYKQSANAYSKFGYAKSGLGFNGIVFEPNDEIKGDIARIYFYMATCYQHVILNWTGGNNSSDVINTSNGTTYLPFQPWVMNMMLRWSKQDPVDAVETARNNAVYTVQQNRNPFVDYPGLEDYVWGDLKNQAFSYDNYAGGGGDVPVVVTVSQPVLSPNGGTFTDQVEVSISCATEGAVIYYTTDGSDATANSTRYEQPFTLTATTTVKAVAVKENTVSAQSQATFTIRTGGGEDTPIEDGAIALNNAFFGTSFSGTVGDKGDFTGTADGITVVYSKGTGSNQYINDEQIRLYSGNTLTFTATHDSFTQLVFEEVETPTKILQASTGTVDGLKWTGDASEVVFEVNSGKGHLKLSKVSVTMASTNGIGTTLQPVHRSATALYTLTGIRVSESQLRPGIYIQGGKKIMVK